MRRLLRLLAYLCLLLLFASCSSLTGNVPFTPGKIAVSDARALALTDNASTASVIALQSSESGLVKITEDGRTADPIEDSTIRSVNNIWRLGPYTILYVERVVPEQERSPTDNQICQFLLLVDGDAYECLTLHAYVAFDERMFLHDLPFQLDGQGNIYYMSLDDGEQAVFKYGPVSKETSIVVPGILPFYLWEFAVAPDGTVYLDGAMDGDADNRWIRSVAGNGDITHIGDVLYNSLIAVYDNKLYLTLEGLAGVRQVDFTSHELLPNAFYSHEADAEYVESEVGPVAFGGTFYHAGDRVFSLADSSLYEVFPTPHQIVVPLTKVTHVARIDDVLYLLGETESGTERIVAIDLLTEEATPLHEVVNQDLNSLVADGSAGVLYFEALNFSPLQYQLGRLDLETGEIGYEPMSAGLQKVVSLD